MTRKLCLPAILIAVIFVLMFAISPFSARAQSSPWDTVIIEPESGNWNYPGYFIVTATVDVTLSWEIKCTEGGCFGREADLVFDYFLAAGESVRIGWGDQCYRWQFDPIDWDHGYIAEPDPEVCALLTVTPTVPVPEVTPTSTATVETPPASTPDTPTPTITGTIVSTPIGTPGTATPTSTGTVVTTPPTTPGTATPTSTGTLVTTPPTTPGTATTTPTVTVTPSTPNQSPTETPRSQLIAVTGADLSGPSNLSRLFVSLGIVLLGLGLVRLGITRKPRR